MNRLKEIQERMDQIAVELRNENADVEALTNEVNALLEERAKLVEQAEKRQATLQLIAKRNGAAVVETDNEKEETRSEDILASAEYRSAFLKRLQNKPLSEAEQRAMTTAQNSVGTGVPTTTLNRIDENLRQTSALYNEVEVLNIPGYLSIPKEDVTNDASWIEEDAASTDVNDTLKSVNFAAYKLIRTISITAEVEAMTIDAFETYIVSKLVDKMAIAIEHAILNGTGEGQPKGILKETLKTVKYTKGGEPTYKDICKMMAKIGSAYKRNSKFVMNPVMLWETVATMTVGDKLVFVPDPTGEFAGRILGRPVIEDDEMPEKKILLGNLKKYTINFNKTTTIDDDNSTEFRKGNKVYRGMALLDGKVVNTEAFVLLEESQS